MMPPISTFACAIRFSAAAKSPGFFSIPIKFRPVLMQATPVEPLPMQLSSTVSPGSVYVRISHSHSATGFSVG